MRRESGVGWRRTVVLVTLFVGSWFAVLDGQVSIPPRVDRSIHDYAGVLAPAEIATLEQQHRALFEQTEVSVVIVTIDTLEGENASDFGLRIAESWQPGTRATERDCRRACGWRSLRITPSFGQMKISSGCKMNLPVLRIASRSSGVVITMLYVSSTLMFGSFQII